MSNEELLQELVEQLKQDKDILGDMPTRARQAYNRAGDRDARWFLNHPKKKKYTRAYIYGELWPLDVPLGTLMHIYRVGNKVIRHADYDNPTPFPGYEEEGKAYLELITHVTLEEIEKQYG